MRLNLTGAGLAVLLIAGAGVASANYGSGKDNTKGVKKAVTAIEPRSGSHLSGKATFTEVNGKVVMELKIKGAEPGVHAVHLHENGDCTATDAASAGGHWNPSHEDHGKWGDHPFHHGDIGNLEVGKKGKGTLKLTSDIWTIGGPPETDVVGKSIIVHAKADDFTTQPTGNAGGRFGCGVVKRYGR